MPDRRWTLPPWPSYGRNYLLRVFDSFAVTAQGFS